MMAKRTTDESCITKNVLKFKEAINNARTVQDTSSVYDVWANNYESCTASCGFSLPKSVADFVLQLCAGDEDINLSSTIIDFCAGTGYVGAALRANGFTGQIDAHDGSQAMLEKLKEKQVYKRTFCQIMEKNTKLPEELTVGSYNISIICSSMFPGHVNYDCLEHFVNSVKVGGLIICTLKKLLLDEYLEYNLNFEREAFQLEKLGILELIDVKFIPKFRNIIPQLNEKESPMAIIFCYKKLKNLAMVS